MFSINLKSPKFLCWASQVVLVLKTLPTNAGYIGNMGLGELWELMIGREPGVPQFMGSQRVGHD